MSRKANKPIAIPSDVTVTLSDTMITVKGPKGELTQEKHPIVAVATTEEGVVLTVKDPENKTQRALWGTFGSLVRNMIEGVTNGYTIQLEINGVGYGFDVSGNTLTVKAGYSHPVKVTLPESVKIAQEKNVITLTSHDKQLLGHTAAQIRKIRKPEPYKGKGIKYVGEIIIRKQGKQAGSA